MTVSHVEVLVEEASAEAALRILLPKVLGGLSFQVYRFQGKHDLLKRLPERLRGYAAWLPRDHRILVLVDRDDDDCRTLKEKMEEASVDAGLRTRRSSGSGTTYQVVNRIAIEELEAWYFGDWEAVRQAYPKVNASVPSQAKYRDPDAIAGGTWEAFERVMRAAGYFKTGLRKIEAARTIAEHWRPEANRSHSFRVFCGALQEMIT